MFSPCYMLCYDMHDMYVHKYDMAEYSISSISTLSDEFMINE